MSSLRLCLLSALLFLPTLSFPTVSFAGETYIRCRGTAPAEDLYFYYEMDTFDEITYQVHLTYTRKYNQLIDDGWKTLQSVHEKIVAPSPWPDTRAILKKVGERWDLYLVNAKDGTQIDDPPFDNFVCVPRHR